MRKPLAGICWLLACFILGTIDSRAENCPTAKDEIVTDRPDVTNSSLVVPTGSLQNENGVNFAWQEGYGAFGVSPSRIADVQRYIRNQGEHHKKRNFEQEFVDLLQKSGVEFDEKYVFG